MLSPLTINQVLKNAFREDLGSADITTYCTVPSGSRGKGRLLAKEEGVIAGLEVAEAAFCYLEPTVKCNLVVQDGDKISSGQTVMEVSGLLQPILSSERIALNIIQRLSGIATQTARWVNETVDYPVRITDTRKTTPGLRMLEKYAVHIGGGLNHRLALDGGILIKENHIVAAGSITEAVKQIRLKAPFTLRVEVEVTNLDELKEAIEAGVDIVMLDNMSTEEIAKAVQLSEGQVLLEASGNINLERLKEIAATGVDFISCGALTHSFKSLDFSFLLSK